MNTPFTVEQFLQVFENYNLAVWPMQVILNLFGVAAIILAFKKTTYSDRTIATILSFLWLWIGITYHLVFFTTINKAAHGFGVLYILQSVLFLATGVFRQDLSFRYKPDFYGVTGGLMVVYAILIYPVLGYFLGHVYPKSPTFGLPCPTTIFTFGLLLWTAKNIPKYIFIIPFLWSLIGSSAAISFGISEDFGLLLAGVVATTMVVWRDRKTRGDSSEKFGREQYPQVGPM